MTRRLNSRNLADYLAVRINAHSRREKGQSHVLLSAEVLDDNRGVFLEITNHMNRVFHVFVSYVSGKSLDLDKVELGIKPDFPGVSEGDFAGFLSQYIARDQIFQRKMPGTNAQGPLHGHAPRTDVLQRKERTDKMECLVVDEKAGNERVRKAVYDYMMRPGIFYMLKKAGDYSKQ